MMEDGMDIPMAEVSIGKDGYDWADCMVCHKNKRICCSPGITVEVYEGEEVRVAEAPRCMDCCDKLMHYDDQSETVKPK